MLAGDVVALAVVACAVVAGAPVARTVSDPHAAMNKISTVVAMRRITHTLPGATAYSREC